MEANACLSCRFSSIKLNITVPEKYDTAKFARETKKYADRLAALTKQKPIHYALNFQEQQYGLDFNVTCACILNVKKLDCSHFNPAENLRIRHLNHNYKLPTLEVPQNIWK